MTGGSSQRWTDVWLATAVLVIGLVILWPAVRRRDAILYSKGSDILEQHRPFRILLTKSILERRSLPTWNPTAFGGMPLVGDPQAGLYYPFNWLFPLLNPACDVLFSDLTLLHAVLGGWGMLWWLKGFGARPAGRFVGAITFAFAGKWLLHLVVPGHVIFWPIAFAPWLLGLVDRLRQRPTFLRMATIALFIALVITGLHPQLLFYLGTLMAGYVVVVGVLPAAAPSDRRLRFGLLILAAALLGLMLSAAHWHPTLMLRTEFVRGQGLPYDEASKRSQPWPALLGLILPSKSNAPHWEEVIIVGALPTVLALLGWWTGRRRWVVWFWAIASLLMIWFATGKFGGLHHFLYASLPGFDLFRIPTRALLLLGLPIGVLAAVGTDHLLDRSTRPALGVLIGLAVLGMLLPTRFGVTAETIIAAFAGLTPLVAALVDRWTLNQLPSLGYLPTVIVVGMLTVELVRFAQPLVDAKPVTEALGTNPLLDRIAAPPGQHRSVALNYARPGMFSALPVAQSTPAGIENLRGFNPLIPLNAFRFVRTGVAGEEMKFFGGTGIREFEIKSRPHLDRLNVRWIASDKPLAIEGLELREVYQHLQVYHFSNLDDDLTTLPKTHLYENTRYWPRCRLVRNVKEVSTPQEAIEQLRDGDDNTVLIEAPGTSVGNFPGEPMDCEVQHDGASLTAEVDAGAGGYLVFAEMYWPFWSCWIDGERHRVYRANGAFVAVQAPAGKHRIKLKVDVRPAPTESILQTMGWLIIGVGGFIALVARPTKRTPPS